VIEQASFFPVSLIELQVVTAAMFFVLIYIGGKLIKSTLKYAIYILKLSLAFGTVFVLLLYYML